MRYLRDYDGDIFRWWDDFRSRVAFTKEEDMSLTMVLGCTARLLTGRGRNAGAAVRPAFWCAASRTSGSAGSTGTRCGWSIRTPTRCSPSVPCGSTPAPRTSGSSTSARRAFRDGLLRIGLPDERVSFELFEGTHMAIDYRYPLALAWLAHRLAR